MIVIDNDKRTIYDYKAGKCYFLHKKMTDEETDVLDRRLKRGEKVRDILNDIGVSIWVIYSI